MPPARRPRSRPPRCDKQGQFDAAASRRARLEAAWLATALMIACLRRIRLGVQSLTGGMPDKCLLPKSSPCLSVLQRATQLDEMASKLKETGEANAKLDKENAANLHK